jgi:thiaminase/transcriptional activator TenA
MRFMQQLWRNAEPIFIKAIEHPFAQKLSNGTLELSALQTFLAQDALYLKAYAQTLTLLADKAQSETAKDTWLHFAADTRKQITTFEQRYFPHYAVTPAESPTEICLKYTSFLLHVGKFSSYSETLAAVAPCFIFYYEAGKIIAANSIPNNPYAEWITNYSCPFFASDVQKVKILTNQAALESNLETRENMQKLFIQACEFEWAFMDSAYQQVQLTKPVTYTTSFSFWQKKTSNKYYSSLATISKASYD